MGVEPSIATYVENGIATKVLPASHIEPGVQLSFLVFSSDLATRRTEVGTRFMTAYERGARDFQNMLNTGNDRDQVLDYLTKYTPLKDGTLLANVSLPAIQLGAAVNADEMRKVAAYFLANGNIDHLPDTNKLVDPQFTKAANEKLGPYAGQ